MPAVGFSIGFERIFSILSEQGADIPDAKKRIAVLYGEDDFKSAVQFAEKLRSERNVASVYRRPKKTGKFIDRLEESGFAGFIIIDEKTEVQYFDQ